MSDQNGERHEPRGAMAFLLNHAGIVLPGMYLLASAIGMLDSWWYYRQFGIDIFLYSDLADFLLASFRSPTAWIIVVVTLALLAGDLAGSRRAARRAKASWISRLHGSRRYRQVGWVLTIPFIVVYIVVYAGVRANMIHEEIRGREVSVTLADGAAGPETAILLGSSLNFIFLYSRDEDTVSVHPYENVLTVESPLPERR
jgi:hypothetical protein